MIAVLVVWDTAADLFDPQFLTDRVRELLAEDDKVPAAAHVGVVAVAAKDPAHCSVEVGRQSPVVVNQQVGEVVTVFGHSGHEQVVDAMVSRLMRCTEISHAKGLPGEIFSTRDIVKIVMAGLQELGWSPADRGGE